MADAQYWIAWRRKDRENGFLKGPFWDRERANGQIAELKRCLEIREHDFSPWFIADSVEDAVQRAAFHLGIKPAVTEIEHDETGKSYSVPKPSK